MSEHDKEEDILRPMKKIADFVNDTPLLVNAVQPSRLKVQVWQDEDDGHAIVVISETADNPGQSVTNAAEQMATFVINKYDLQHYGTTWVEHYPDEYSKVHPQRVIEKETFDTIQFTWHYDNHVDKWVADNPEWHRIGRADVEEWIGEPLVEAA